jgi:undecaprenyl-diphosphatase
MWFADVGVAIGWLMLAAWMSLLIVTQAVPRDWIGHRAVHVGLPVLAGTGIAAVLFAAQAGVVDIVEDPSAVGVVDSWTLGWFVAHRSDAVTIAMSVVSNVGGTVGMAALALIGATLLLRIRRRAEAGIVLGAALGAGALVTTFKNLYDRARPPVADRLAVETNAALPSGHALGSIVTLGVLAAVVVLVARRPAARAAAVASTGVAVVTIGVSRLYLGVHWLTDVLTGWLLGGAWLALCVTALAIVTCRRGSGSGNTRVKEGDGDVPAVSAADR